MECKTCNAELRLEEDRLVCPKGHYNEKALICTRCNNPMDRSGVNYEAKCHGCGGQAVDVMTLVRTRRAFWAKNNQAAVA